MICHVRTVRVSVGGWQCDNRLSREQRISLSFWSRNGLGSGMMTCKSIIGLKGDEEFVIVSIGNVIIADTFHGYVGGM